MLIITGTPAHFYIYTDRFGAVQALKHIKAVQSKEYFIRKILELLGSLFNKAFRISLVWIPAHTGIIGNERAVILAKRGAAEGELYERPIFAHEYSSTVKDFCMARWQRAWDTNDLGRHLYAISSKVTLHL